MPYQSASNMPAPTHHPSVRISSCTSVAIAAAISIETNRNIAAVPSQKSRRVAPKPSANGKVYARACTPTTIRYHCGESTAQE